MEAVLLECLRQKCWRDSLSRKISDIQDYDFVLADNAYKANMKTVLAEAENLADNAENMDDIRAMIQKLEEIKNDIQSVGTIENVKLDGEYVDWETIGDEDHYIVNGIRIMGVNNTPGEIEVAFTIHLMIILKFGAKMLLDRII